MGVGTVVDTFVVVGWYAYVRASLVGRLDFFVFCLHIKSVLTA